MRQGDVGRHYHRQGYAMVVLAGAFIEAGISPAKRIRRKDISQLRDALATRHSGNSAGFLPGRLTGANCLTKVR